MTGGAFWAGRKVFLTGHTGFKGAWLTLMLEALGAEVHGYALDPPTRPDLWSVTPARLRAEGRDRRGDVRDPESLARSLAESRAEVAFHLAAQSLVGRGHQDPAATFEVNVMGTVNFLEALRRAPGVRAAVVVTSDKCYETPGSARPRREGDALGGDDPYSASKGAAELAARAYARSWAKDGPAVATVRAGNVIGGGDFAPDRLVPDAVRAFAGRRPLVLRRPAAVRPWQHVLEPLAGYLALARGLADGRRDWAEAWNFGPASRDHWPVGVLAARLAELWGPEAEVGAEPAPNYPEAAALTLCAARARRQLGWRPRLGLPKALAWTVEWYRAFHHGEADPAEVGSRQIRDYLRLIGG